jgi:hypothetical protein
MILRWQGVMLGLEGNQDRSVGKKEREIKIVEKEMGKLAVED